MKKSKINPFRGLNSIFNIGFFEELSTCKNIFSRVFIFSIIMYAGMNSAFAQLNSTSSQTISTTQTYTGTSRISNSSTVTISGGTSTFTGSLTVGNSTTGKLIIKSGATVIVNGYLAIGTSSNGSIVVENGGKLIVNPGATTGGGAVRINSSATLALDVQTGGSLIINAGTGGMLGMSQTGASQASIAGSLQIRGGGFKMDGTSALTYSGVGNDTIIGPSTAGAYFSNSTKLTVGAGVNLYISGDVKNDSNAEFAIDGNVSINGNYQSGNTTANVTGTGTLNTTGTLDADSYQGSVFGERYSCASGPCAGSNVITSSNTTTCNGGTVNITGAAVTGANYQWYISTTSATSGFTAISGATNQNYSTTGSSTKQYTYYKRQYTLSSNTYNSNTLIITSSYWTNAATVNNITGSNSICTGNTTTLANTTTGGVWSSSNTAIATITSGGVVTGAAAGTSIISYTVNGSGCASSKTLTMTVNAIPTITSTTPGSRCGAGTVTLEAAASAGTISWYNVATNGTALATGTTYSPSVSGTTTYYVSATNGSCITASRTAIVATVNTAPTITGTTAGNRCGAGTIALGATSSAGTVNWYTASTGGTSIAAGITYNPTVSATTTFYVDATNNGCTTASRTAVVATVNPVPTVFVDKATASICAGSSVTLIAAGDPGKTLTLSGPQYIKLDDDPLVSATDFTFEAMIYWTDNSTQWQRVFDFGNNTNVNMFFTTKSTSGYPRYAITTTGNGGEQQINTTTTITTNAWHHVAITYKSATTTGTMYLDGVSIGTNTSMTINPSDLAPKPLAFNYFGKSQYLIDPNFEGRMDEIRIWDIARTSTEINNNKSISVDPNSSDLVAYYKLNEGTGTELTSVSGTSTANLVGTPTWVASTAPVTAPGGLTTTYAWSPSTGLNTATGATVTASSTANQTYTVTATYNNSCSSTATSVITVAPAPTAVAGTAISTCSTSGSVNITAGSDATNYSTVAWSTSNGTGSFGTAGSLTNATYTPSNADKTAGSRTLVLTVTGTGACSASTATSTKTITISAAPTASAGGTQTICQSNAATVSGATSSNGTITWTENGAGSITGASTLTPVYTSVAADGGTTVTLTMTVSNSPCVNATATYSVVVGTCLKTWTGASSTAWATNNNWSPTTVPTATDDVVIPSSVASGRMPIISTSVNAKSITNSGTITFTSAGTLNTYGNITNSGTVTTVAGSDIVFKGASAQTLTGVSVAHNVEINNTSGGVSLSSAIIVKGTLSLTKGILTTNSNLTINFDNGGNIGYASGDLGSISGNVSGRRDVLAKTHYIAVPFSGVTSAQVQETTPLFMNPYWKMYTKTFAAQNWAAVTNTTTAMPLGTGFSLSLPAAAPLIFTGTYDHTYSLTGPAYSNAAATKYIMVGNPYPSTIDWGTTSSAVGWTKTNVANAIYYWDGINSRSASYVAGVGTNGATRYIPAMQSVLVSTTGTGGSSSVSVNNNARLSSQNPSYFRIASEDIIRLTLSGTDTIYRDEAVIRFNEMATDSFDFDLDAYKILNTGFMPSVYTNSKNDIYSINSFESVDSTQYIPVAAKLPLDGEYTLKIAGNNSNIEYILVDKLLGIKRSIETDSIYTFSGSKTDDVNRFELQLRTAAVTIPPGIQPAGTNGGLDIFSSPKGFVIKTDRYAGEEADIEILDITGNSIKTLSGRNLSAGSTYIATDLSDGSYLVKVSVDGNTFAGMIVLVK